MTTWTPKSYPSTTWTPKSYPSTTWRFDTQLKKMLYPLIKDYLIFWLSFEEESGKLICPFSGLEFIKSGSPIYRQPDWLGRKKAIKFNPATFDYFYHANAALFDVGTDDFVIWTIIKPTAVSQIGYLCIKYEGAGKSFYQTSVSKTSGKLSANLSDGTHDASKIANTNINDGNYHLVEFKFDRSSSVGLDIFLDGSSDLTTKGDLTAVGNQSNAGLFRIGGFVPNYYQGLIPELLMIKATDLSPFMTQAFAQQVYEWSELN